MVSKKNENNEILSREIIIDTLMRKWSILILKDMFLGAVKFSDFLERNPRISGKVLSDQLKNLEKCGFIEKVIVTTTPLKAEYRLTEQGRALNRVIYELLIFARKFTPEDEYKISDEMLREYFGM
jgi:DNA-binding HxlR family transcriptional regulator